MTSQAAIPQTIAKRNQPMPVLKEFYITQEATDKLGFNVRSIPDMIKNILRHIMALLLEGN